MSGYIITKNVSNRWTYYLEYLELNGRPVWNGLKCNGKQMNLTNCMLVLNKLRDCFQLDDLNTDYIN